MKIGEFLNCHGNSMKMTNRCQVKTLRLLTAATDGTAVGYYICLGWVTEPGSHLVVSRFAKTHLSVRIRPLLPAANATW